MMRSELGIDIEHDVNIHLENRKESRYFFVFIWIMYAVVYMTKNCYNGAMAGIVEAGVMTKSQTGLITAIFYLLYAPMQIVGGKAADKFSPEKLIKIGLLGGAFSNLVIFLNQNYYVMLAVWTFNAIIQFGLWPSVFKIISSQLVRSDRKQMVFYISFCTSGGLLLSYIVSALLPDWKMNFAVSAVALAVFAVGLHLYERHLNPLMKWDRISEKKGDGKPEVQTEMSTFKLFAVSGFFLMSLTVLLRTAVSQVATTLTPVMLMESYEDVPAYLGNLLNLLVIGGGIAGILIVKLVLYPKYVRSETKGSLGFLVVTIPCTVLLSLIGTITVSETVITLCAVSMLSSAVNLLTSYYTADFVKFGRSGAAAGVSNAFTSLGIVSANYGILKVSEVFGWKTVMILLIILVVVSTILMAVVVRKDQKFKKSFDIK